MGLFSFLKDAGAKLFGKDDAPKEKSAVDQMADEVARKQKEALLKSLAEGMGIEVENLSVSYDGETVTVWGQVESQADKEKIILTLGNVNGVATVDDRMSVVVPEPEADFYEVKKGDSLSKIAKEFYGNAMKYPVIFEANKPMLKDPDLIYPGQVLRIPKQ
ncbi:MAG: peptidoglycan-binding protein LysM, partial [Saprospiraceae bacterium]